MNNQDEFCKIGAEVLNLSIRILLYSGVNMNICISNSPPSKSRKTLALMTGRPTKQQTN